MLQPDDFDHNGTAWVTPDDQFAIEARLIVTEQKLTDVRFYPTRHGRTLLIRRYGGFGTVDEAIEAVCDAINAEEAD